jgi:ribosome recycling factor
MAAKKGKSKGKGKGKGGGKAVDISDLDVDLGDTDAVFIDVIAAMDKALGKIKVGEVSADLLDEIMLDIEGDQLPLAAVAQVAKKDAQTLICTVFDPSLASKVETAVRDAGLGLEPARQGEVIRVAAPKMTQDYRADLTKMAKDTAEKTKAKIRRTRADGIKDIKSVSDGLGKDDTRRLEDYVSWKANAAIDAVQDLLNDKVAQIAK